MTSIAGPGSAAPALPPIDPQVLDEAASGRNMRECGHCGLFQLLGPVEPGGSAHCLRCCAGLRRVIPNSLNRALACYTIGFLLLIIAVPLPYLDLRSVGRFYQATLFTGPRELGERGMWEVGAVVLAVLIAIPFVHLLFMLTVLLGLRSPQPPRFIRGLFGWAESLRPWSMVEVFLLGSFVAYTRLQVLAVVEVGPALIALGGVMLASIAGDIVLDREAVWEQVDARGLSIHLPDQPHLPLIGCDCCHLVLRARERSRCPRCGSRLYRRKLFSTTRAWALLAAGAALYVPANIYPVMTVSRFGQGEPNTLISGVIELAENQMWPLAILVFLASITVPMFKLVGLCTMLIMTNEGSARYLRARTTMFRVIDSIGRWSMIDVFMLTILVGLVRMGFIATVLPGLGAIAFAAVVVLTMFGAASFDPRLMWDAAAAAGHDIDALGAQGESSQQPAHTLEAAA